MVDDTRVPHLIDDVNDDKKKERSSKTLYISCWKMLSKLLLERNSISFCLIASYHILPGEWRDRARSIIDHWLSSVFLLPCNIFCSFFGHSPRLLADWHRLLPALILLLCCCHQIVAGSVCRCWLENVSRWLPLKAKFWSFLIFSSFQTVISAQPSAFVHYECKWFDHHQQQQHLFPSSVKCKSFCWLYGVLIMCLCVNRVWKERGSKVVKIASILVRLLV